MLKLKQRNIIPPGGWKFFVKESGATIKAPYFPELTRDVRQHLAVNSWTVPENLDEIIEDQVCQGLPSSIVIAPGSVARGVMKNPQTVSSAVVLPDNFGRNAIDRTISLIADIRKRRKNLPLVDAGLAEARAERVKADPYKCRPQVCYSCKHQYPVDQNIGRTLRTSQDNILGVCGVFGAYHHALIWIEVSALEFYISPARRVQLNPEFWLHPELNIKE